MVVALPRTYNAAKDMIFVHKGKGAKGKEQEVSRLNGRDMVERYGWSWGPLSIPAAVPEEVVAEAPPAAPEVVEDEDFEVVGEPDEEPEVVRAVSAKDTTAVISGEPMAEPADVSSMHLTDAAMTVLGTTDVQEYLNGFPFATLRALAKDKFEKVIHHRATKDTAVAKLVEFEEARIMATAD